MIEKLYIILLNIQQLWKVLCLYFSPCNSLNFFLCLLYLYLAEGMNTPLIVGNIAIPYSYFIPEF